MKQVVHLLVYLPDVKQPKNKYRNTLNLKQDSAVN